MLMKLDLTQVVNGQKLYVPISGTELKIYGKQTQVKIPILGYDALFHTY